MTGAFPAEHDSHAKTPRHKRQAPAPTPTPVYTHRTRRRPHSGMILGWGENGAWNFDHADNKIRQLKEILMQTGNKIENEGHFARLECEIDVIEVVLIGVG